MRLILFLSTILSVFAFAQPVAVNCASGTLTTSYAGSSPSLQTKFTNLSNSGSKAHLAIINPVSSSGICATVVAHGSSTPAALNATEYCTAPSSLIAFDEIYVPSVGTKVDIYLRADQASCTTGVFYVDYWNY